jgi:ABC-type transporter Mla subunit MlaD
MSEWKNRKQQEAQPLIDPPPPALAQLLENFGADIWNLARVAADQALDGKRRVIEENAAQIREQAEEAIALADSMDAELHDLRAKIASLEETAALYRELQANYHALEERAELELKHQKEHSAQEIHRAVTRANEKDSEAIEARKNERQALDRAARAEGQVEALEKQLGLAKRASNPQANHPRLNELIGISTSPSPRCGLFLPAGSGQPLAPDRLGQASLVSHAHQALRRFGDIWGGITWGPEMAKPAARQCKTGF